jgi:putative transposase
MIDPAEPEPPRRRMHRVEHPGHVRFLTFSCHRRLPLLDNDKIRALFVARLASVCVVERVRLLGWVVMPEHVHLVVFPDAAPDVRRFTHALKRPVAESVLRRWKELGAPILARVAHGAGHRFWQTGGGYDRNLFDPEQVREKIRYIHDNPVRRGLAPVATDYPWSSARWYAGLPDAMIACGKSPW